ncbi:phosphomevalonate kinase [Scheffersomyces spartinae]|uniref:Phosphomevalonate kinase n=1 Tax=Scheffersomyces spartinae TaxID=45513 RepID=A0A9P7V6U4_9ASCO|nr:phosphomevalonate kinase [Scheffersomyces spartinae]KAG7192349.1 phosphomevalonate kinase [Scheffersomyces spartinae]
MVLQAFSAPGKALLAGGYLVLDPEYNSYVTALSSRMHCVFDSHPSENELKSIVSILSPQFAYGKWVYEVGSNSDSKDRIDSVDVHQIEGPSNPFVESVIRVITAYVGGSDIQKFGDDILITIFLDPEYHTRDGAQAQTSSNGKRQFLYHQEDITSVPKTGLGSSAGLVTVLTAALAQIYIKKSDIDIPLDLIHNLAQIAHCYAQGKIGSGFDVAAAVYGSIKYRRFDPELIADVIDGAKSVAETANREWNFGHQVVLLPPRVRLVMGDIKGGSNTPKLVSLVLNWKNSKPSESDVVYEKLNNANELLIASLQALNALHEENPELYDEMMDYFSQLTQLQTHWYLGFNDNLKERYLAMLGLISAIRSIRSQMRTMTRLSAASIEPIPQTFLLNQLAAQVPGCIGGVVPGAGGYDAVALLVVTSKEASGPLALPLEPEVEHRVSMLQLREEAQGLKPEDVKNYTGLL